MTGYRLSRASIIEHLALACDLDLQGFCERFQKTLALPKFEFGHENMTEWGLVEFRWGFALRIRRHFTRFGAIMAAGLPVRPPVTPTVRRLPAKLLSC